MDVIPEQVKQLVKIVVANRHGVSPGALEKEAEAVEEQLKGDAITDPGERVSLELNALILRELGSFMFKK